MSKQRQHRSTTKVRRVAPRPRNQPKLVDDGMQHFLVSVPRQSPKIDQAVRERVASTIEGSQHPQRFTDIEDAASAVPPVTRLAPDPDDVAASMQRLHEKLGIPEPDAESASQAPDYGAWFQPTKQTCAPRSEESWQEALVAVFGCIILNPAVGGLPFRANWRNLSVWGHKNRASLITCGVNNRQLNRVQQ
jgi:hypothetical protein